MKNFQKTILAALISCSVGAHASDDNNTTTDKSMGNTNNTVMGNCASMTGNDKAMCDKDMKNSHNNSKSSEKSHINRDKDMKSNRNLKTTIVTLLDLQTQTAHQI